jgi:hypothetical protein
LRNQIRKKGRELKRRRQVVGKIRERAEEETKIKNILKNKESKKSINEAIESKLGEKARNIYGKNKSSINIGGSRERAQKIAKNR